MLELLRILRLIYPDPAVPVHPYARPTPSGRGRPRNKKTAVLVFLLRACSPAHDARLIVHIVAGVLLLHENPIPRDHVVSVALLRRDGGNCTKNLGGFFKKTFAT